MRKLKVQSVKCKVIKEGFTLIEFLIAVAIITLLVGVILWPYANFRDEKLLDGAAEEMISLLNEARIRTLSSDGGLAYGVFFESDKMTLLPDNREVWLSKRLSISDINLTGGGATVTFKRLTGATDQGGTVTISLVSDPNRQRIITINAAGGIGLYQLAVSEES
ncbi:MAG TPA: prepilin-type N-terminal cleavage/methylation domain-containing protein [Candidatus Paceibacterota bacterium]